MTSIYLTMLLKAFREGKFPKIDEWNTLDIDYEQPVVHRLWKEFQIEGYMDKPGRIMLHRIYYTGPEKAYYHPHPWESTMLILKGSYLMELGDKHNIHATLWLPENTMYEMNNPNGWHSVSPIGDYCDTIMITGELYDNPHVQPKSSPKLKPLSDEQKTKLYYDFLEYFTEKPNYTTNLCQL